MTRKLRIGNSRKSDKHTNTIRYGIIAREFANRN